MVSSSSASVQPSAASTSSSLSSVVLSTPLNTVQPSASSPAPSSLSLMSTSSIAEPLTPIASSNSASSSATSSVQQISSSPSPSQSPSSITPTLDIPSTTPTALSYSSSSSDSSSSVSESITVSTETLSSSSTPISTSTESSSTPMVSSSPSPQSLEPSSTLTESLDPTTSSSEITQTSSDVSSTPTPSAVITSSSVDVVSFTSETMQISSDLSSTPTSSVVIMSSTVDPVRSTPEITQTSSTPTPSAVITSSTVDPVSFSLAESSPASSEDITSTASIVVSTSISVSDNPSEVPTSSVDMVSFTSISIIESTSLEPSSMEIMPSSSQTSSSVEIVPSSTPEPSQTLSSSSDTATMTSSSVVETTPIATTSTVGVSSSTISDSSTLPASSDPATTSSSVVETSSTVSSSTIEVSSSTPFVASSTSSSAVPVPTPFTPSLITNGGFEDPSATPPRGGAGSTVVLRESTPELPAYAGTRYLEFNMAQTSVTASRSISLVFPNIAGVQGTTYRVSVTVRSQTGMLSPQCYVHFAFGVNIIPVSYFTGGSAWEEVSTNFRWNFGTGQATPIMLFNCPGNAAYSFGVDNVQVLEIADPPATPEALPTPFRNAPPQNIPSVGATCGQAIQEPSFELFPAATPNVQSPWEFVGSRYALPYVYTSGVEAKRTGTRALRVTVNALSSGYTASMEFRQRNVVVCPNTLYEFKSWNVLFTANSRLTCQVGLKVNGGLVAMGDRFIYTASREFAPTSGYYLTGSSEMMVNLDLKLYCVGPTGLSTVSTVYFDDVTFTPVSSL
ncbi:hypothetical protein Ptr86124_010892 [Pyrenophora tritici-repentis]|uniref:CBM-cenC domain-containing protein n=1 Tax=Pyrenophora tritici-repentis TaxID=45151 RepID=A0A922SQG6_9PLEO|nr:hypothetical protein Ptr86124_010892 [Pyrenophora tritici-repentis]